MLFFVLSKSNGDEMRVQDGPYTDEREPEGDDRGDAAHVVSSLLIGVLPSCSCQTLIRSYQITSVMSTPCATSGR